MKTQTLLDAIRFIDSHEPTRTYIKEHEAAPKNFEIYQISATVGSQEESIVRVLLNFGKKPEIKRKIFTND